MRESKGGGASPAWLLVTPCPLCRCVQVPRPPHWGGFLVRPLVVEFWQGRPRCGAVQCRRAAAAAAWHEMSWCSLLSYRVHVHSYLPSPAAACTIAYATCAAAWSRRSGAWSGWHPDLLSCACLRNRCSTLAVLCTGTSNPPRLCPCTDSGYNSLLLCQYGRGEENRRRLGELPASY